MLLVTKKAAEHVAAAAKHTHTEQPPCEATQGMTHQPISATSRKFSTMKHSRRLACQVQGLRTLDLCKRLDGHWQRLPGARVLVFRRRRVRCIRRERENWRLKHHGHGGNRLHHWRWRLKHRGHGCVVLHSWCWRLDHHWRWCRVHGWSRRDVLHRRRCRVHGRSGRDVQLHRGRCRGHGWNGRDLALALRTQQERARRTHPLALVGRLGFA